MRKIWKLNFSVQLDQSFTDHFRSRKEKLKSQILDRSGKLSFQIQFRVSISTSSVIIHRYYLRPKVLTALNFHDRTPFVIEQFTRSFITVIAIWLRQQGRVTRADPARRRVELKWKLAQVLSRSSPLDIGNFASRFRSRHAWQTTPARINARATP